MPIDNRIAGAVRQSDFTSVTPTTDDLITVMDANAGGSGIAVEKVATVASIVGIATAASASLWLQSGSYVTGSIGVNEVSGAVSASVLIPVSIAGVVYYIEGFKGKSN